MKERKILAHISPNQNAYSETFIQNHRKHFEADVKFYYGGYLPEYLEGTGLLSLSKAGRLFSFIKRNVFKQSENLSYPEKALLKSFKEQHIEVVYAEYGQTGVAVLNVCKSLNLPLIVNFHGYDISVTEIREAYTERYRQLFDYVSNIVAVSKVMVEQLVALGCAREKIVWTPCAPDDTFFSVEPSYSEDAFLYVGRFVDKKAPYYPILALEKVVERHPDCKLYMAGGGELLNTCVNLVKYLKLENNVHLLGKCDHNELMEYYSKVRGYVQHSITAITGDTEGTPVAVLEASAAALPVVSTRHAGIPDVIVDGLTGLLVDEHDVDGMANNMMLLLENIDKARELGLAGREFVRDNFSTKEHMKKLNALIDSCP